MAFWGFLFTNHDESDHQQGAKSKGLRPGMVALLHISPVTAAP